MESFLDKHVDLYTSSGVPIDLSRVNMTMVDKTLVDVTKNILNTYYVPTTKLIKELKNKVKSGGTFNHVPPQHIPAEIKVYHSGVETGKFYILFPESVSESLSAQFIKENPVGSTYPIVAFSNTSESSISLSFVALSDYLPEGFNKLEDYLKVIRSMVTPTYPSKQANLVQGPSVYVRIGGISFYGVCDSISIDYDNLYGSSSFVKASISCQFTITSR